LQRRRPRSADRGREHPAHRRATDLHPARRGPRLHPPGRQGPAGAVRTEPDQHHLPGLVQPDAEPEPALLQSAAAIRGAAATVLVGAGSGARARALTVTIASVLAPEPRARSIRRTTSP